MPLEKFHCPEQLSQYHFRSIILVSKIKTHLFQYSFKMEEICNKFPLLSEQINELLDNQTLARCKKVSRSMHNVISNQKGGRFYWIRMIKNFINEDINEFKEDWKIISKTKPEILKKFAILVKTFYNILPARQDRTWSPMHIVAERGDLDLCKYFAERTEVKNPRCSEDNWTPLHFAAQIGHFELFQFLAENLENNNPETDIGLTPLHLAVRNGHLKIYQFICQTAVDTNPTMDRQITPLHLAAKYGHFEVCQFIFEYVQLARFFRSDELIPFDLA